MAMSPVLTTMLSSDMIEGNFCKIVISDFTSECLKAFIEFLYKQRLPSYVSCEDIIDLWALGDRYDVPSLRCQLGTIHAKTIVRYSFFTRLIKTNQFGAKIIKEQLLEYFLRNHANLCASAELENLPKQLMVDLLRAIP